MGIIHQIVSAAIHKQNELNLEYRFFIIEPCNAGQVEFTFSILEAMFGE
jgi:hypothetical protein